MKELHDRVEHCNVKTIVYGPMWKKRHDHGEKDVQDSSQVRHSIACNKGKESIVPDNIDTPMDDELSSGSSPDLTPGKVARLGCARSARIAQHSATQIVTYSVGRKDK